MSTLILLAVIAGIILLGRYAIAEGHRVERNKKFMKNLEEHGKKTNKEINSISPLFNDMTGIEIKKMMDKEFKIKHKIK
jgi:hypothetical protein